ncbi:MAG: hypothetical protein ABSD28_03885 [Tepidisphaeraceae bacterium]|jgi:hypothetical protein
MKQQATGREIQAKSIRNGWRSSGSFHRSFALKYPPQFLVLPPQLGHPATGDTQSIPDGRWMLTGNQG